MENNKTKILSIVAIATFMMLVVGATYAYFTAQGGNPASANLNVTTYTTDVFTFETGTNINIYTDQTLFSQGKGNATGSTFARATLTANNKTNTATENYNLYLNISDNTFKYTINESTPELLLTIKDANNNEVTSISGLEHKTITDGKGAQVSGFDITTKTGLLTLLNNKKIVANPKTIEEWNITVTFINYNSDQTGNTGKTFDAQLLITKDDFSEYTPNTINTLSTTKSGNNLTVNLAVDEGSNTISKYYYAIEETSELAMLDNKPQVMRLSNTLAANTLTYVESDSSLHTFSNINSSSNYNIYAYAIDNKKIKMNTYNFKYSSSYNLPVITNVEISKASNSITLNVTATKGTNNISKYYYSVDNGNSFTESTSNSYTFSNLNNNTNYRIVVKAMDSNGKYSNTYVISGKLGQPLITFYIDNKKFNAAKGSTWNDLIDANSSITTNWYNNMIYPGKFAISTLIYNNKTVDFSKEITENNYTIENTEELGFYKFCYINEDGTTTDFITSSEQEIVLNNSENSYKLYKYFYNNYFLASGAHHQDLQDSFNDLFSEEYDLNNIQYLTYSKIDTSVLVKDLLMEFVFATKFDINESVLFWNLVIDTGSTIESYVLEPEIRENGNFRLVVPYFENVQDAILVGSIDSL